MPERDESPPLASGTVPPSRGVVAIGKTQGGSNTAAGHRTAQRIAGDLAAPDTINIADYAPLPRSRPVIFGKAKERERKKGLAKRATQPGAEATLMPAERFGSQAGDVDTSVLGTIDIESNMPLPQSRPAFVGKTKGGSKKKAQTKRCATQPGAEASNMNTAGPRTTASGTNDTLALDTIGISDYARIPPSRPAFIEKTKGEGFDKKKGLAKTRARHPGAEATITPERVPSSGMVSYEHGTTQQAESIGENAQDVGVWLEEDPGECQGHEDQRVGLNARMNTTNRATDSSIADENAARNHAVDTPASSTMSDFKEEVPFAPIDAHVVGEIVRQTRAASNPEAELLPMHLAKNAPLVSEENVQVCDSASDSMSRKSPPRNFSKRTWTVLALVLAITVAAATLMGVLLSQGSTASSEEGTSTGDSTQGRQESTAPTCIPSLFPSLAPTVDQYALRLNSIWSILEPISGAEALSNVSSPQYRALEWVSFIDSLRLPYDTEVGRKRIIQRYVLATLYYATGGEHWASTYHFLEGLHECEWWNIAKPNPWNYKEEGVFCSKGKDFGVDALHIISNNLTGTLPSELEQLSEIWGLGIYNSMMGGPIPAFIANMTSLVLLSLSANKLTGSIPVSLGGLTRLERLYLFDNDLTATIPSEFGNLTSLDYLQLQSNKLTGIIPESFGSLTSLEHLEVSGNDLTATIPSELGNLISLVELDLSENNFTGTIPESFSGLTNLEILHLYNNDLNGTIMSELGNLTSLAILSLHSNKLIGTLPKSFGGLSRLGVLSLRGNKLTGTIPDSFRGLTSLRLLYLYDNELTGTVPHELCFKNESGQLILKVDPLVTNGSNFLCECILVQDMPGCCVVRPDGVGDGSCDPYEPYYTDACNYDNGDCALCPEGTYPAPGKNVSECCVVYAGFVGDGWCDGEPYNTEVCGWDGGDCCEETCDHSWKCGSSGYDCKNPTISDQN